MSLRTLPMAGGDQAATARARQLGVYVSVAFVGSGIVAFLAGACLLVAWGGDVAAPAGWAGPHALALTHVLALGFVTSTALGVLYHLAPLAFGARLRLPLAGLGAWLGYETGVGLLVTGLSTGRPGLTAVGGCSLAASIAVVAVHLGSVAAAARRRYGPTMFQVTAVLALGGVAALGATLALMLDLGAGASFLTILAAKIVLAVGGWLGLLVVGVSYQLIPMFTLTPARARFLVPVLVLLGSGVLAVTVVILASLPGPVRLVAALVYAAGIALHLADVARFFVARRDARITPVMAGQTAGALLLGAGTVEGVVALAGGGHPWPQLAVATALAGWTPALIAANAIRIVPFIVWQGLPAGRRPRTYGSAPVALGWAGIAAAAVAWALLSVALGAGSAAAARAAGVALLGCAVSVAAAAAAGGRVTSRGGGA